VPPGLSSTDLLLLRFPVFSERPGLLHRFFRIDQAVPAFRRESLVSHFARIGALDDEVDQSLGISAGRFLSVGGYSETARANSEATTGMAAEMLEYRCLRGLCRREKAPKISLGAARVTVGSGAQTFQ